MLKVLLECSKLIYLWTLLFFQYFLCSCLIALVAVSVFLRVDFLLKLVIMISTGVGHVLLVSYYNQDFFKVYYLNYNDGYVADRRACSLCPSFPKSHTKLFHSRYPNIPFEVKSAFLLSVVICILHVIDRHTESRSRADFLWKAKLKVSQVSLGGICVLTEELKNHVMKNKEEGHMLLLYKDFLCENAEKVSTVHFFFSHRHLSTFSVSMFRLSKFSFKFFVWITGGAGGSRNDARHK